MHGKWLFLIGCVLLTPVSFSDSRKGAETALQNLDSLLRQAEARKTPAIPVSGTCEEKVSEMSELMKQLETAFQQTEAKISDLNTQILGLEKVVLEENGCDSAKAPLEESLSKTYQLSVSAFLDATRYVNQCADQKEEEVKKRLEQANPASSGFRNLLRVQDEIRDLTTRSTSLNESYVALLNKQGRLIRAAQEAIQGCQTIDF